GEKREDLQHPTKPVVVVAHDLSPAQTVSLDRKNILGLVTEVGSRTSHTAIVAASLGIPAVVGVEEITNDVAGGDPLILDGVSGKLIVDPDEATGKRYQAMYLNFQVVGQKLTEELHDLPAETKDGHKVSMLANIETPDEVEAALKYGAEGIGLYRTEFLYLKNELNPSEKDHLKAYRRAISLLGGRKLVIRTLDLGADKILTDGFPPERNPFMGTRAIRLCLERPEIFKVQLRASLRAALEGDVHIMYPMVSSESEVGRVEEVIEEVRKELEGEGMNIPRVPVGIMVEVPSAALIADLLAKRVDFMSVGTNDLIAYAIAVDRNNERVAPLYEPAHPAILRLLKHVIDEGEKAGKPVSVCGEIAGDVTYTLLLLGMGLKAFSMVPPAIPEVKKMIRSVTLEEAREVAKKAFEIGDSRKTVEFLHEESRKFMPEAV
ncbi:MAG: phosphoenolpyruvate--protein phosphotransferase, partial [Planctomycetota bacterium]